MKEPDLIFTDLFIDFQRMHNFLRMACEDSKDDIRISDPDFLLEEGEKLLNKWCDFVGRKCAQEVIASLNED